MNPARNRRRTGSDRRGEAARRRPPQPQARPRRRPGAVRRQRPGRRRSTTSPGRRTWASARSTVTSRPRRRCSRRWRRTGSSGSPSGHARRSRPPMPGRVFRDFLRRSAELGANDRLLSEAMAERDAFQGAQREKDELMEATAALVERAQATGELRPDIGAQDIAMLMCGLGRATGPRCLRPRDELGALPGDHHRRPSRAGQPAASVSSPAYELARGRVGRACGAAPRRRVGDFAAGERPRGGRARVRLAGRPRPPSGAGAGRIRASDRVGARGLPAALRGAASGGRRRRRSCPAGGRLPLRAGPGAVGRPRRPRGDPRARPT